MSMPAAPQVPRLAAEAVAARMEPVPGMAQQWPAVPVPAAHVPEQQQELEQEEQDFELHSD